MQRQASALAHCRFDILLENVICVVLYVWLIILAGSGANGKESGENARNGGERQADPNSPSKIY